MEKPGWFTLITGIIGLIVDLVALIGIVLGFALPETMSAIGPMGIAIITFTVMFYSSFTLVFIALRVKHVRTGYYKRVDEEGKPKPDMGLVFLGWIVLCPMSALWGIAMDNRLNRTSLDHIIIVLVVAITALFGGFLLPLIVLEIYGFLYGEEGVEGVGKYDARVTGSAKRDPLKSQLRSDFQICDKRFESETSPQKLVVEFINRGSSTIRVKNVRYSDTGLGLPEAAILPTYRSVGKGYFDIPFDQGQAEVSAGESFVIEIGLAQTWNSKDIRRFSGNWGYLRIDVLYKKQNIELFEKF